MADVDPLVADLRRRRLALGLTQRRLAARLGLAQSVLSGWETGAREVSVRQLRRWAAAVDAAPVLVLQPGGDGCDRCRAALADRLRDHAEEVAGLVPAGRLEARCGVCGRVRTYALTEVDGA